MSLMKETSLNFFTKMVIIWMILFAVCLKAVKVDDSPPAALKILLHGEEDGTEDQGAEESAVTKISTSSTRLIFSSTTYVTVTKWLYSITTATMSTQAETDSDSTSTPNPFPTLADSVWVSTNDDQGDSAESNEDLDIETSLMDTSVTSAVPPTKPIHEINSISTRSADVSTVKSNGITSDRESSTEPTGSDATNGCNWIVTAPKSMIFLSTWAALRLAINSYI